MKEVNKNDAIIGGNIKRYVKIKCVTLQALAEALGVSNTTMSQWVNGKKPISAYTLCRISKILRIDITELVEGTTCYPNKAKVGTWLERKTFDEPRGKYIEQWQSAKCSVCGKYHTTPYLYHFHWYDYCPSCGTKMEVRCGIDKQTGID